MAGTVSDNIYTSKIKSRSATDMVTDADGTNGVITFKSDNTLVGGVDNNGVYTSETEPNVDNSISTKGYIDTGISNITPTAPTISHVYANSPQDELGNETLELVDYIEEYDTLGEYYKYDGFTASNAGYYLVNATILLERSDRFRENDYLDIHIYINATLFRTARFFLITTDRTFQYPFAYIKTGVHLAINDILEIYAYNSADKFLYEPESYLTISRLL